MTRREIDAMWSAIYRMRAQVFLENLEKELRDKLNSALNTLADWTYWEELKLGGINDKEIAGLVKEGTGEGEA